MKKLILIFLLFASCQTGKRVDTMFDFKLYENKCKCKIYQDSISNYSSDKYGFKIDFPKHWETYDEEDTSNQSFSVLIPSPDSNDKQLLSILVAVWKDSRTSDEYFKYDLENLKTNYDAQIIEQGQYVNGSLNYNWVLINIYEKENYRKELLFYTKKGQRDHYLINFTAINLNNAHEKICEILPLIDSFKL